MLLQDKRGEMFAMMANLLFLVMALAVFVALIPMINTILNNAQQSDNLNCNGYLYNGNPNHPLSHNDSIGTNDIACIAIRLYLPYIALVVLIGGVGKLLSDRVQGGISG